MRHWLIGLGLLLGASAAAAGSWTCTEQTESLAGSFYLVLSRCSASGTYTTAGDVMGDGSTAAVGTNLCNSAQRMARGVLVGNTANAAGANTFVATWDQSTSKVMLATAPTTPAPGTPLAQVASGTSLAGFTLRMIAVCQ
jgi:microcompartment protein CcmK/EutM